MKLKIHYFLTIFLLGVFILSMGTDNAVAHDDDGDDVDDSVEFYNGRNIEIEWGEGEFEIESELRYGISKDEIEFEVEYESNGLSIENEYEREIGSGEFELEFKVVFYALIEYDDVDSDGKYNSSVDTSLQTILLNNFDNISYTSTLLSNGDTLHYIIVNTTDGVFTAHIYVVEQFALVNGETLTPFEAKIDIEIKGITFGNPNSRLALYTKLESEAEYEFDEHTEDEDKGYAVNESSFMAAANGTTGFFSWTKTADVDGVSTDVLVSEKEIDGSEEKIYFNYQQGARIYHDPKIGMMGIARPVPESSSSDDDEEDETLPIMEIAIVSGIALAVGAIGLVYLRQKKLKAR